MNFSKEELINKGDEAFVEHDMQIPANRFQENEKDNPQNNLEDDSFHVVLGIIGLVVTIVLIILALQ